MDSVLSPVARGARNEDEESVICTSMNDDIGQQPVLTGTMRFLECVYCSGRVYTLISIR